MSDIQTLIRNYSFKFVPYFYEFFFYVIFYIRLFRRFHRVREFFTIFQFFHSPSANMRFATSVFFYILFLVRFSPPATYRQYPRRT